MKSVILSLLLLLILHNPSALAENPDKVITYIDTGSKFLLLKGESGWQPVKQGFQEYELPITIQVENAGGVGLTRIDLEDPGLANDLVIAVKIDGVPLMQTSLFDDWEYEESLEVSVLRFRDTELASSKISMVVTTPSRPLSQGCDPNDVFFTEGFGTATSSAQASQSDAESAAEEAAGNQANRDRDRREILLACNRGCKLTPGPQDFWNSAPVTWRSKSFSVADAVGNPVPAWWGRTYFGWRAMYTCVPGQ